MRRLLVGPEKRKGFYGYFLAHGWIPMGPFRRHRISGKEPAHGQAGKEPTRGKIPAPYPNWFESAVAGVESAAAEAYERTFEKIVDDEISGMK